MPYTMDNHSLVTERRLQEAMDKLDKHHPQIAGRLRTIWKREDEALAKGDPLPQPYYEDDDIPQPAVGRWWSSWFKGV